MSAADVRSRDSGDAQAPLFEGLGGRSYPVTTAVPLAQRFFDQGLLLAWGFDFEESERSFREAARLDPTCAMCEWGIAHVLGPTFNHPYRDRADKAARHVQRAVALSASARPHEQALIRALAVRFAADGGIPVRAAPPVSGALCTARTDAGSDRLDVAYAQAMAMVAAQFPDDVDIAVLHAEALMLLAPWEWWTKDRGAGDGVPEAITVLQRVLEQVPDHPAANHYLIHAYEQSPHPDRALAAATRLGSLAPGIGHLVHMPAHVFMRLGRYSQATRANEAAIDADARRAAKVRASGFAPLGHTPHHLHFLWASAGMEGRGATAIAAAREIAARASEQGEPFGPGTNDYFRALPLLAQVRFGQWHSILAESAPGGTSGYPEGVWRFARGVAYAYTHDPRAARKELTNLERIVTDPSLRELELKGIDSLAALLGIAVESLRGEVALAEGRHRTAIEHLRRAVRLEDALESEEPPPWLASSRVALASALLRAGRPREAAAVFREDLARHPGSGWSLHGLAQSLRRQGRHRESADVATAFRAAWAGADSAAPHSRY